MTPAEHYREAERLLRAADESSQAMRLTEQMTVLAFAQVHATLATAPIQLPGPRS